jgi:hypothetical protein
METFIKYLFRNLALVLPLCLALPVQAQENLRFKGDYFLFSDDIKYIYGSGNITLKTKTLSISGDVLYMDVNRLTGVIYGNIKLEPATPTKEKKHPWDAVFFKAFPLKTLNVAYREKIIKQGDKSLEKTFLTFKKKRPEELKKASLYFEFREFRVNKNKKVKAKTVIPYMMGLPTVPVKRFTVNRGQWADKTMFSFNNINYTGLDGLSLSLFLRLKEKLISGDYDIKLYERQLFKLGEPKRGIQFSGNSRFFPNSKQRELFGFTTLLNSGDESFNVKFYHTMNWKHFSYTLSQTISGREDQPAFLEFRSHFRLKGVKWTKPAITFTHNLKKSYSYRVKAPFSLGKRLRLGMNWQRKSIDDSYRSYRSDTSDISTSMNFSGSFFSLSSNYNYSRNLIQAAIRKNFTVNLKLKPLRFLERNIVIDMSSFYMFSSLPAAGETRTRISPGVTLALRSAGAALPLGFKLVPAFTFNHLWDNREENFTDFNYVLSLQKEIGHFTASANYALASRYRADNFWIEGSNRQNLHLNLEFIDKYRSNYSFLLRFYHNNQLALENISFSGKMNLPFDFNFSSFVLYYNREKRFQTLEVFIEKTFKKKIKIQGGYSLALKRFFIKFLTQ